MMLTAADLFLMYLQTLGMASLFALTLPSRYRAVPTLLCSSLVVACIGRLLVVLIPAQMPLRFAAMIAMQCASALLLYRGRVSAGLFMVMVQFLLSTMAELTSVLLIFIKVPDINVQTMTLTPDLLIIRILYQILFFAFEAVFLLYFHRTKLHLDKSTVLLFLPFPVSVSILMLGIYATGAKALSGRTIIPMIMGVFLAIVGSILVFGLLHRMGQKVRLEEKLTLMQSMQQMEQSYHLLLEQNTQELALLRRDFKVELDAVHLLARQYHGDGQAIIEDILNRMYKAPDELALPTAAQSAPPPVQTAAAKPDKMLTLLFWLFPISQVVLLAVMVVSGSGSITGRFLLFLAASIIFTVLGGMSLFKLTQSNLEKVHLEEQLAAMQRVQQLELEYYELVQQRMWEGSVIRHDFKDRLATVYGIMHQHSPNGSGTVQAAPEEMNRSMPEPASAMVCRNRIVDTIVNVKRQEAEKLGIAMEVNLHLPKELTIASIDLCSVFSNLLNNAIEACGRLPETTADPTITLKAWVRGGYLVIKLVNPTAGEPPRKDGRLISTKSDRENHGLGMLLLENICQRYAGRMDADYADGLFTVSMTLELAPAMITA